MAAEASLPLAAVNMPHGGNPCRNLYAQPGWAVWILRDTLWLSMAFVLPVSIAVAGVLAWRTGLATRRCTAVGLGIGAGLVLTSVVSSMATASCQLEIYLY